MQDSGLRPVEVIRMQWDNVLGDKNLIFNPNGETAKARRHVPLSDRVGGRNFEIRVLIMMLAID